MQTSGLYESATFIRFFDVIEKNLIAQESLSQEPSSPSGLSRIKEEEDEEEDIQIIVQEFNADLDHHPEQVGTLEMKLDDFKNEEQERVKRLQNKYSISNNRLASIVDASAGHNMQHSLLMSIQNSHFINSKILKQGIDMKFISQCLPDFEPITNQSSGIVGDAGLRLISHYLPPLIKMQEWTLLFSIDIHGCSMETFFNNVVDRDDTVMLIETTEDQVIGAFMTEEWSIRSRFYGSGESSFVFNIERQQKSSDAEAKEKVFEVTNITEYGPTFKNTMFQYADRNTLTIGSSQREGTSAILITKNFRWGFSDYNDTFTNPPLTTPKEFNIKRFEVWGFQEL